MPRPDFSTPGAKGSGEQLSPVGPIAYESKEISDSTDPIITDNVTFGPDGANELWKVIGLEMSMQAPTNFGATSGTYDVEVATQGASDTLHSVVNYDEPTNFVNEFRNATNSSHQPTDAQPDCIRGLKAIDNGEIILPVEVGITNDTDVTIPGGEFQARMVYRREPLQEPQGVWLTA